MYRKPTWERKTSVPGPGGASKQVAGAWLGVYHNADKVWDLYELAERLVDLDHNFQLWRCHHMKTVERIIGYKPGTGGTGGVSYLVKALELKFFPELWQIRTLNCSAIRQPHPPQRQVAGGIPSAGRQRPAGGRSPAPAAQAMLQVGRSTPAFP